MNSMWSHLFENIICSIRSLAENRVFTKFLPCGFMVLLLLFPVKNFAADHPSMREIKQTLSEIYHKYENKKGGKNADYIPELAKVDASFFGITIVTVDGEIASIGNSDVPFAIESIAKPFLYILALNDHGEKFITHKIGLNATGHSFNSLISIEENKNHLQNPFVNAGAMQTVSFIKGKNNIDKWVRINEFIQKLSDGKTYLGEAVYHSETATNQHNRAMAELLNSYGKMGSDPGEAVDLYTKACSIMVTTKQLAIMGASLANNGIHPIAHHRMIPSKHVKDVLSQMVTNGLYETSGAWFWTVGIPAKSGVGGGILAVIPHKMAIAVFSPPLDEAGNSVRAQQVITELSERWHLHLLGNE